MSASPGTSALRQERVDRAFFRGARLNIQNPAYKQAAARLIEALLEDDLAGGDVTVSALEIKPADVAVAVVAGEAGVIAGVEEFAMLYRGYRVSVSPAKRDGEMIQPGETVLRAEGDRAKLLALERTGLNLLQRMSGLASAARRLQERVWQTGSSTRVVGTRKTPWGVLDKRALHLGGVGTHRLGLGDAILIKNNHLALIASREEDAAPAAIEKAWQRRANAAFIEVEVRSAAAARAAAETFRKLQAAAPGYPCVLMLDNMTPAQVDNIMSVLRREGLWSSVLVEASGGISESNIDEYAACGTDAISVGALTHSVQALDISQKIL
ncbi:MAG TPA: carboxylating nicotinate-nucleotide diphosphorylase [Candidatus Acidoferrales bacterium]|nr:carboxylating nicotinate-nucleotide diphosphorylase [Candidatus Acidoferrales bacterium]